MHRAEQSHDVLCFHDYLLTDKLVSSLELGTQTVESVDRVSFILGALQRAFLN